MQISTKDWKNYISRLSALNNKASSLMSEWVAKNGFSDTEALIDFAYAIVTKYGEGSAELTCQMYDAIAEMEGKILPAAVPAQTATYDETAKAVKGCLKRSPSGALVASTSARLVKQVGADTMIHNALRDGAEFAWIPSGDTCPFCLMHYVRGIRTRALRKRHGASFLAAARRLLQSIKTADQGCFAKDKNESLFLRHKNPTYFVGFFVASEE